MAHLERLLKDACPEMALDHMTPVPRSSPLSRPGSEGTATDSTNRSLRYQSYWQNDMSMGSGSFSRAVNSSETAGSAIRGPTGDIQSLDRFRKDVEILCVNSAIGQPHYLGPSSALGLSKIIGSAMGRIRFQGPGLTMGSMNNEFLRDLPRSEPTSLPSKLFGSFLSDAYFTHVHPQYPFLHQPTFLEWENDVYYAMDNAMSPDPTQLFFVNMVCQHMISLPEV